MATKPSWVITAYTRPAERDLGAGVLGQHQDQRGDRHQFPGQQERRHRCCRRHQQHRRHEQRKNRQRHPAHVVGVADRVDADGYRDRPGERDEEPAERVEIQRHPEQREQPADMHRPRRAEHTDQPGPHPESAEA